MAILLAEFKYGWNRHVWDIPVTAFGSSLKSIIAAEILFAASAIFTKASMVVLTLRLCSNASSKLRKVTILCLILIALEGTSFFFLVIFQCNPIDGHWKVALNTQKYVPESGTILVSGIITTVTDLVVVLLPLPLVRKYLLPRKQQAILVVLFGAGGVVTIAGAFRSYYTYEVTTEDDHTWCGHAAWLTCPTELYVGIIGASLPPTHRLFIHYFPKAFPNGFPSNEESTIDMGHYPTKCGISDVVVTSIVVSKVTVPPLSRCRGRHDRDDIEMGWRETLQPTLTPCFYNDRKHWSSKTDVIRKKLSFDPALWRLCNSPDWNAESHEARESIKADSEEQIQLFASSGI